MWTIVPIENVQHAGLNMLKEKVQILVTFIQNKVTKLKSKTLQVLTQDNLPITTLR